ncbi:hypothetical protein ACFSC4_20075 [Deinococcus malanensis]|uniref:hypothetical protein n=1 Tax=Deinococcus malanensis TaxID=1706855 RepID=UPI003627808E
MELEQVTPTHRLLTVGIAEEMHDLYHVDLQDDIAREHGIEKNLLPQDEYEQALKELGVPVFEDGMDDASVTRPVPWPLYRPDGCSPDLLRQAQGNRGCRTGSVHAVRAAAGHAVLLPARSSYRAQPPEGTARRTRTGRGDHVTRRETRALQWEIEVNRGQTSYIHRLSRVGGS